MTTKKTITLCASAAHYRHVIDVEKQLKQLGYRVKVPKTARVMARSGNFDVDQHKTWYQNQADYKVKTQLMKHHIAKVIASDAILVVNDEKRAMPGYIGGNVLIEMALAFHYRKPIFILNAISDQLPIAEEVYGMNPMFLDGDLKIIQEQLS